MKIPEWLADTQRPTRPEGGSTEPIIERLAEFFAKFFRLNHMYNSVIGQSTIR